MRNVLAVAKGLSDEGRLRALMALHAHHELCVCDLTSLLGLATATVSRHMSVLQRAELVDNRKEGRWVYYRLASPAPNTPQAEALAWVRKCLHDDPVTRKDQEKLKTLLCSAADECCDKKTPN